MNIIFIGPQGSGKGTQAELISKEYNIPHISTGDIFRSIREKNTKLGKEVRELIDNGTLVPDDITNQVVEDRLSNKDCNKGFILDGYPRSLHQARFLSGIEKIDRVIDVEISDSEAVKRLSARLTCKDCGQVYNMITHPSKRSGLCDKCNGKLIQRDDDKPAAIKKRLNTYHKKTQPLIDFYKKEGVLVKIKGKQPIGKVFEDIRKKLGN